MSVVILGGAHANHLASAAAHYGLIPLEDAPQLARVLLQENIDAYLLRYWDGPTTFDDWDELDEDEKEGELVDILQIRDDHRFSPAQPHQLVPAEVQVAVDRWFYQVNVLPDHRGLPGWQTMDRLARATT